MEVLFHKMETLYNENMPDSLYLDQYELTEQFGATPEYWEVFLKDPERQRTIEQKLAQIAEAGAKKALKRLQQNPNSSDIQAAKQLLENSKLLQQKHNPTQHVILTYIPQRKEVSKNE